MSEVLAVNPAHVVQHGHRPLWLRTLLLTSPRWNDQTTLSSVVYNQRSSDVQRLFRMPHHELDEKSVSHNLHHERDR